MQTKIDFYINKQIKPFFEQLEAVALIENIPFNQKLAHAVEHYIKWNNGKIDLICPKKYWVDILKNMNKNEMIEANRYISELNNMLLREIYHE